VTTKYIECPGTRAFFLLLTDLLALPSCMKKTLLIVVLFFAFGAGCIAQSAGDYQSLGGQWELAGSWEIHDGVGWNPAVSAPSSANGVITILAGHTITISTLVIADQVVVAGDGTLNILTGGTLRILNDASDPDLLVNVGDGFSTTDGYLNVQTGGTLENRGVISSGPTLSVAGTYLHNRAGGAIATATFEDNSLIQIQGITSARPSNLSQSFYDLIWLSSTQSATISLESELTEIRNNFTLSNTNGFAINLTSNLAPSGTTTVGGSVFINGTTGLGIGINTYTLDITGNLDINSSRSPAFNVTAAIAAVIPNPAVNGNVTVVVGGNLTKSNTGSVSLATTAALLSPASSTALLDINGNLTWNSGTMTMTAGTSTGLAVATINLAGNLAISAGSFTETATNVNSVGVINFDNGATHAFSGGLAAPFSNSINLAVGGSSTLNIAANSQLTGTGTFLLNANATLGVASTAASGAIQAGNVGGNLRSTGTRTYTSGSTIIYNGTSNQIINGAAGAHPSATGITTRINNSATRVSLQSGQDLTLGGALFLDDGNLAIAGEILTLNGTFTATSPSSIEVTAASNIVIGGSGAFGTLITSGSTTINSLAFNRTGQTLTLGSNLTIVGSLTHTGNINFNNRVLIIDGNYTPTSGSITGNISSSLVVSGVGAVGTLPLSGSLGKLTIDHPSGVTNTTSITIGDSLNIISGTYQGSGSVILNSGATIRREDGIITKSITATSYNLYYTSTAAINTGSELVLSPVTALNNLTIESANSVTVNAPVSSVTVNGTLSLLGGEFISNAKPLFLEGNVISNATGTFTGSIVTFSGSSTLSGAVSIELDDVEIETGSTLNLGTVNLQIAGDFTPDAGAIMVPGSASTFFNGTTVLTLPDVATQVQFHNVLISSNSSLTVSCASCGSENNRPAIMLDGIWDSDAFNAVFNPAPNIGSNIVTGVRFIGGTQSIKTLAGHSFWDLRLAGTGTVTLQNDLLVSNDLELEGTKTLSTGTNRAIGIGGDFLFDGGSLTVNQSNVTFSGTANQVIDRLSGSGTPSFFNITVNKSGGTFSNATNVNLTNVFTISSNTAVDFDGPSGTDIFTLASTSARTAIVAAILSPANPNIVTGSVTAQRYMDGEGQIYRYISAPVTNPQVVDLQGEISVTGTFTGTSLTAPTNCVGCAPCTGCSPSNPQSMFRYNGALAGTVNQRYEDFPATANTETMEPARGYSVFVREASNPTTWNLRGQINRGLQTFTPLAFTGVSANDSYNLVGNPYPSPIDWFVADGATTWARTNIDPTIYTWDASIGNYATYNRMTNTGTNSGSRYVAVGQAFWIRTTAGGASMTASEGAKATQQPTFFREKQPEDYLRMKLLASNGNSNEALVHFNIEGASDNFDSSIDSYSFPDAALKFFTLSKDARPLAINALGALDCTKEISVSVGELTPGIYSIQYSEFESFTSPVNITLVDSYTGKSVLVNAEKPLYEFNVTADSTTFGSNRFKLIFSNKNINLGIQATAKNTCVGNEGQIKLATSQTDVTYFASIDGTRVSEEMKGNGSQLNIDIPGGMLAEGENTVVLMAKYGSCDAVPAQNFKIGVGPVSIITQVNHASSCQPAKLKLGAEGAKEGAIYRWYESARGGSPIEGANSDTFVTPELENSKSYFVSILNASGCESDRMEVKAEITTLEPAQILIEGNTLRSNHPTGNRWLKDGEQISEEVSVGATTPAVYTLEVRSGECLTAASYEHDLTGIHIFPNPANETITINVESSNDVKVEIFNTIGVRQGSVDLQPAGMNRRTGTFDLSAGASGMYLIQIKDGAKLHLKKILKR
jgi:hypothetical protein